MKTNEIIRELMDRNGVRFNQFATRLGLLPNALASRLKRGNFSTDKLNEMLDVFGYKIVLVPKDTEIKPEWYEIENSKSPESDGNDETI